MERFSPRVVLTLIGVFFLFEKPAFGDHGPGTSGGGISVVSGETLKKGQLAFELREDFTEFDRLSNSEENARAMRAGEIDLLDRSSIESLTVNYGFEDYYQLGLSAGYYGAVNARSVESHHGEEIEVNTFNPDGLTDLWLNGKARLYRGPNGNFSVFAAMKFPTGNSHSVNSSGEPLEPSATAGSNSYDGMLGLSYSRFLTARLSFDASGAYTGRTESDDFRLGDRFDAGVAIGYRLSDEIVQAASFSVFGEGNLRHLLKSEEGGLSDHSTGGTALFITGGGKVKFGRTWTLAVGIPIPIFQDLNGEQLETSFKVNAALTAIFP